MMKLVLSLALVKSTVGTLQIAKGGGMCAGMDDSGTDHKIYYGACESAATVATSGNPYFTVEMTSMGLLSGSDTAYLTDPTQAQQMTAAAGSFYKESAVNSPNGNGGSFAYVTASVGVGSGKDVTSATDAGAGGMFGTAFYLGQTGTTSISTNRFPAADPTQKAELCISEIENGVCGAERTFGEGAVKFSIYGAIGGTGLATAISGKSYIAFRTEVGLNSVTGATVLFNDGVPLADLNGADVTQFSVSKGTVNVTHTFPSYYNVGTGTDCTGAGATITCVTTAANSFTRPIKIKASATQADGVVNLDYLFAIAPSAAGVNDGLEAGRYFVYDPDVAPASATDTTPTPTPAIAVAASGATALHASAAASFLTFITMLM